MANFHLYKFKFEQIENRTLFASREGETLSHEVLCSMLDKNLRDVYNDTSAKSLTLYATQTDRKGDSSSEIYVNKILNNEDGITLMEVRNNKIKKIMPADGNEEKEVDHHPICWVIIDTRPHSPAILIQQKISTFASTDFVKELIRCYVARTFDLHLLGWEMQVEQDMCGDQIWSVVNSRTADGRDRVKALCLKFDGKRPAHPDNPVDVALQMIREKLVSPDGELKLNAGDSTQKLLDETMPDVKHTVDMLIENQYHIKVYFDKSGSYEHGKNAPAIHGTEDSHCEAFAKKAKNLIDELSRQGYDLVFWLDTLMSNNASHNFKPTESRRKKRNARK